MTKVSDALMHREKAYQRWLWDYYLASDFATIKPWLRRTACPENSKGSGSIILIIKIRNSPQCSVRTFDG